MPNEIIPVREDTTSVNDVRTVSMPPASKQEHQEALAAIRSMSPGPRPDNRDVTAMLSNFSINEPVAGTTPRNNQIALNGCYREPNTTFYGGPTDPYWEGRQTASGEPFHSNELTMATGPDSPTRIGERVRVTNISNGESVVVRVNDRKGDPGVDLSHKAMEVIGGVNSGRITTDICKL